MSKTIEVHHPRMVWVAWTNSDLTEGRGYQIPLAVCEKKSTAIRLGKKGSVQGCDCDVTEVEVFNIGGHYYGPVRLIAPTKEDGWEQEKIDKRDSAIKAAKDAGLSDDQINALIRP